MGDGQQVESVDAAAMDKLQKMLEFLRFTKPEDRSEKARRYAVTITEMEKVVAYFQTWVVGVG